MEANTCLKSLLHMIAWSTLLTTCQVKSLEGMKTGANKAKSANDYVPSNCGRNRYHVDHKNYGIVGGNVSRPGEWPWLVSLHLYRNDSNETDAQFEHMCGGNLINRQWVLTAAHCFANDNPKMWKVILGEHDMFEEDTDQLVVNMEKIIKHPNYNKDVKYNMDSALVKLASNVSITDSVNVVCLPSVEDDFSPGTECVVAGWGHTSEGAAKISDKVRHVVVPVFVSTLCRSIYNITENMICAGYPEGGKDSCQGDSGGPLMYYNSSEKKWILVGIVSFGEGCARSEYPGVYTRVTKLIPWITKTIA